MNMNSKMPTNSQLLTTDPKKKKKERKKERKKTTKQTTRTGTESQKWRSHGGLSGGQVEGGEEGERYRE